MITEHQPTQRGGELKPCPFCGEQARVQKNGSAARLYWECVCDDCDFCGPAGWSEIEAIAAWNRRAPSISTLEAERAAEWNRRRDAEGSRDAALAAADSMRIERDEARKERDEVQVAAFDGAIAHGKTKLALRKAEARAESAEATVERLREGLRKLLSCPAIADENHNDPVWGDGETADAVSAVRTLLQEPSNG